MTISEVIKQLQDALADKWCPWSPKLKASIKLGIKALQRIEGLRSAGHYIGMPLLKGETKD